MDSGKLKKALALIGRGLFVHTVQIKIPTVFLAAGKSQNNRKMFLKPIEINRVKRPLNQYPIT